LIGAFLDQQAGEVGIATQGSPVQRRPLLVVPGGWIGSFVDQQASEFGVAILGRYTQRRLLPLVPGVWIGACGQGCLRLVKIAVLRSSQESLGSFLWGHCVLRDFG
jgi:hypothetical protein